MGIAVNVNVISLYASSRILRHVYLAVNEEAASHRDDSRIDGYGSSGDGHGAGAGPPSPSCAALAAGTVAGNAEGSKALHGGDAFRETALAVLASCVVGQGIAHRFAAAYEGSCVEAAAQGTPVNGGVKSGGASASCPSLQIRARKRGGHGNFLNRLPCDGIGQTDGKGRCLGGPGRLIKPSGDTGLVKKIEMS